MLIYRQLTQIFQTFNKLPALFQLARRKYDLCPPSFEGRIKVPADFLFFSAGAGKQLKSG